MMKVCVSLAIGILTFSFFPKRVLAEPHDELKRTDHVQNGPSLDGRKEVTPVPADLFDTPITTLNHDVSRFCDGTALELVGFDARPSRHY